MPSSSSSSPLLPLSTPPPLEPPPPPLPDPPHRPRSFVILSKLLLIPTRLIIGGTVFIAAATLSSHAHLSRRATSAIAFTALGASQALISLARLSHRRHFRRHHHAITLLDWHEAIGAVRKIIDTFSADLAAPFTLKHFIFDTELLRRHHTDTYNTLFLHTRHKSPAADLVAGRHFADFAVASYGYGLLKLLGLMREGHDLFVDGARPIEVALFQLGLGEDDVIVSGLDASELGLPRHFVARDEATKSIVIAVRGTNSFSDIVVDLMCNSVPFAGGFAHAGMRDAAHALLTAILPALRTALEENDGYRLVCAGHSLGGGVAILLTKILLDAGFGSVKCYAISPPPVFGPTHRVVDPAWSASLHCFVHGDDIVPRLSLESARALVREVERIDSLPFSDSDLRGMSSARLRVAITNASAANSDEDDSAGSASESSAVRPLYVPCNYLHWIVPREKVDGYGSVTHSQSQYVSLRAEPEMFARMLISNSCLKSHFPSSYVQAFSALGLPPRRPAKTAKRAALAPVARVGHYDGELGF